MQVTGYFKVIISNTLLLTLLAMMNELSLIFVFDKSCLLLVDAAVFDLFAVPSWRVNVIHSKYVMEGTEVWKAPLTYCLLS